MSVSLVKGGNVNLSKEAPALRSVIVALGWKAGDNFDLDTSAFLLNDQERLNNDTDFVFFNNKVSTNGSVKHSGDNLTGVGDGDDETISVNLLEVPADVQSIQVAVTIHEAAARRQNFGQIKDAYIRVVDADTNKELAKFDLDEDASSSTAVVFGSLYRHENDWKFKALSACSNLSLNDLALTYGAL